VGYQNYTDRAEVLLGLGLGRKFGQLSAQLGTRIGREWQEKLGLPGLDTDYGNDFARLVLALEGQLKPWLKLQAAAGPDFRRFEDTTAAGFDRDLVVPWFDISMSARLGERDSLTVAARRFMQPTFGGRSVYEDITYELSWKRSWSSAWSTVLLSRAYGGEFRPVSREDWIYSGALTVSWQPERSWRVETVLSHEEAHSRVPNTAGRAYTKELASLSLRRSF
jgi:hypothetical protein